MALRWLDDTSARLPAGVAHRATLVQPDTDLFHGPRQPGFGAYLYRRRTPPGTLVTRRGQWSSRGTGTPTPGVDAVGGPSARGVGPHYGSTTNSSPSGLGAALVQGLRGANPAIYGGAALHR